MRGSGVLFVILLFVAIAGCIGRWSERGVNVATTSSLPPAPVVSMEVYSDFVCPYSREAAPVVRELMRRYDGRLNVSFRHFPLTKHPSAWVAAEAAECARDQGKFWEFHDALFNASGDVGNLDVLDDLGEDVSLNLDKFDDCIDSGAKKQFVAASKQEGMERNVSSTPTFIIGDRRIAAAVNIEAYEIMIDEELAKANASRTA